MNRHIRSHKARGNVVRMWSAGHMLSNVTYQMLNLGWAFSIQSRLQKWSGQKLDRRGEKRHQIERKLFRGWICILLKVIKVNFFKYSTESHSQEQVMCINREMEFIFVFTLKAAKPFSFHACIYTEVDNVTHVPYIPLNVNSYHITIHFTMWPCLWHPN